MLLKDRLRNQGKNRKSNRSVTMVCENCGNMFTMSLGEICWHYEAGNIIPCRCAECRKLEKRYSQDFILETLNNNGYRLNKIFIKNESTYVNITCNKGHTYECSFESFKNRNNR